MMEKVLYQNQYLYHKNKMSNMYQIDSSKEWDEVCIVDDAMLTRFVTQKVCESFFTSIPIKVFESVDLAIQHMQKYVKKKRLIFLDLNMPHRDGWSFLESYTPGPNEKVFILSSSELEIDKHKASTYHSVSDFISKPISMEKLYSLLKNQK